MSGRSSFVVTKLPVASWIRTHSAGDALRSPLMIRDSHVGVMRRYSAISDLAPRGSVLKYSVNVKVLPHA
jgi:hypothetical protein